MRLCRRRGRLDSSSFSPSLCSMPSRTSYLVRRFTCARQSADRVELQCYADWCAANHDIWESRSEKLRESESAAEIVQPAVEDASYDERFSTLFPLSLPFSLVEAHSLEPGPVKGYVTDALDVSALPSNTPQLPATPLTPRKSKWPSHTKLAESPSAKAMRAVYHATLLDQRHGLYSRIRGVPIPGVQPDATYLHARRRSSPGGLNRGDWGAC